MATAALDIGGLSCSPVFLFDDAPKLCTTDEFDVSEYVAVFEESSVTESSAVAGDVYCPTDDTMMSCGNETKRTKVGDGCRIGFRTKSEVEILDDGFKWRKYGKKSVKNSPNPRNYYRCSTEGCGVKKRVERDREDPRFVITTYDGVHNHISPWMLCHDDARLPLASSASAPWGRAMAAAAISSSWAAQPAQWLESFFQDDV
ncbi:WRKY transcription factor [Musa troglodytarum]|uniref:WRKY transcription factor n=1 Tax=Musa troglodytarum TaxID=320322 RepID=A0A9E7GMW2_9LILI|nr:WRKY transcription factor [Musa troglodytarum]